MRSAPCQVVQECLGARAWSVAAHKMSAQVRQALRGGMAARVLRECASRGRIWRSRQLISSCAVGDKSRKGATFSALVCRRAYAQEVYV